jgi:alpha-N-arabinofuranosidase
MKVVLRGSSTQGPGKVWRLGNGQLQAINKVGSPPQVQITQSTAPALKGHLTVPPASVSVYEFPVSAATR